MDKLKEFKEKMATVRPEDWKNIPDIDLYMDQVISYMQRQHLGLDLDGEETLTSAMINNYIKNGLLPRAKGKRYDREHIGYLTAICLLKQVLTVNETGVLLNKEMQNKKIEDFYEGYKQLIGDVYESVSESIDCEAGEEKLVQQALRMAVFGYAQILACKKILQEVSQDKNKI